MPLAATIAAGGEDGCGRRTGIVGARQPMLHGLQQTAWRQASQFREKVRPEHARDRIELQRLIGFGGLRQTLLDDGARFLGGPRLGQLHGTGLLDAVDERARQALAHGAVEIFQAGDDGDGRRHAVGDLDEIANGFLETLLGIAEGTQILDLIDAEDERGAVDHPHDAAEALDDLEGAVLARVGIERSDGCLRQVVERAAVEELTNAAIDARIVALHVKERAHDVDVEILTREARRGDDGIRHGQHELCQPSVVERAHRAIRSASARRPVRRHWPDDPTSRRRPLSPRAKGS